MNSYNCSISWTPTTDVIYRRWLMMHIKKSHEKSQQCQNIFRNVQLKQLIKNAYNKKLLNKNSSSNYISISPKPYNQIHNFRTNSSIYRKQNQMSETIPKPISEYSSNLYIQNRPKINYFKRHTMPSSSLVQHIRDESLKKVTLFMKPNRYKLKNSLSALGKDSLNVSILRNRKVGAINKLGFT